MSEWKEKSLAFKIEFIASIAKVVIWTVVIIYIIKIA